MRGSATNRRHWFPISTAVLLGVLALFPTEGRGVLVTDLTFVDRPDMKAGDNFGLIPGAFGYAKGLQVSFGGQKVTAVDVVGDFSNNVVSKMILGPDMDTVRIDLDAARLTPVSPGAVAVPASTLTLRVTSDAAVRPDQIIWTAPVTNVIPRNRSFEVNQDSEPSVAASPRNIAGRANEDIGLTAFSRFNGEPLRVPLGAFQNIAAAPIYASENGGLTWVIKNGIGVPTPPPTPLGPADQTIAYNVNGSQLYGAFLIGNRTVVQPVPGVNQNVDTFDTISVRSTPSPSRIDFTATGQFIGAPDQPWIQVGPVDPQTQKDRVYVAFKDGTNPAMPAAAVLVSRDGGATFSKVQINPDNSPISPRGVASSVRVAVSGNADLDNRVYAAYIGMGQSPSDKSFNGSVIVVRDDSAGRNGFRDLRTPALGDVPGSQVTGGVLPNASFELGQERLGSDLAIAVDPRSNKQDDTAYVAYVLLQQVPDPQRPGQMKDQANLFVSRSTDSGKTWTQILKIENAALPALAVAADGTWGLLYTRLINDRMSTEFRRNGGEPLVLTSWPQDNPPRRAQRDPPVDDDTIRNPYIGDYQSLIAVGDTFDGAFSASNFPTSADFPLGVVFQRNTDFPNQRLLLENGQALGQDPNRLGPISIDPYFFRLPAVAAVPAPATGVLFALGAAVALTCGLRGAKDRRLRRQQLSVRRWLSPNQATAPRLADIDEGRGQRPGEPDLWQT